MRCVVDEDRVVIEFELDVFNAGAAPARAVLAEASLFNPGATQEQELGAFFANPVGVGNRIDAIPPMKRITLTSQVVAPRASIQEYRRRRPQVVRAGDRLQYALSNGAAARGRRRHLISSVARPATISSVRSTSITGCANFARLAPGRCRACFGPRARSNYSCARRARRRRRDRAAMLPPVRAAVFRSAFRRGP